MNPLPVPPAVDAAIDEAVARILIRAGSLGEGFSALGAALARAAAGGKRLRPALVAATFSAFRPGTEHSPAVCSVAAAFELLHTAFVVHDDVIDHDTERRGIPNISGEFRARGLSQGADATGAALLGDAAAILAGDLLIHEATRVIAVADLEAPVREQLLLLLDEAVYVSAAGELADVENSVSPTLGDSEAILGATFNKTAVYTFSAPMRAGALLAGASDAALRALADAGGRLGFAFQLVDDLIGAFGTDAQAGRAAGNDLREAKLTPLVALARDSDHWPRVHDALAAAHTGPVAVRDAQLALEESGAREDMLRLVRTTLEEARSVSWHDDLPPAAGALVRLMADRIDARIP